MRYLRAPDKAVSYSVTVTNKYSVLFILAPNIPKSKPSNRKCMFNKIDIPDTTKINIMKQNLNLI